MTGKKKRKDYPSTYIGTENALSIACNGIGAHTHTFVTFQIVKNDIFIRKTFSEVPLKTLFRLREYFLFKAQLSTSQVTLDH